MLIGLMMSTWMLSMWISNTATVTMMLPIAEAVMVQLETTVYTCTQAEGLYNYIYTI